MIMETNLEDLCKQEFRSPIKGIKKIIGTALLMAGMTYGANLPAYAQEEPEQQRVVEHTVLNPVDCRDDAEVIVDILDESLQPEKEVRVRVADCDQRGVFFDNRFRESLGVRQGEDVVFDRHTYDEEGNPSFFPIDSYCNDEKGVKRFTNYANDLDLGYRFPVLIRGRDDERDSHCGVSGGRYNNNMDRLAGLIERLEGLMDETQEVPTGIVTGGEEPVAQTELTPEVPTETATGGEEPEVLPEAPQPPLEIYLAHIGFRGGAEVNPYYVEELGNGNYFLDLLLRVGERDGIIMSHNPEYQMELPPIDIIKLLYNSGYAKLSDVIQHTRNAEYLSFLGEIDGGDFDLFKSLLEKEGVNDSFSQSLVRNPNGDRRNEIKYDNFVDVMGVMAVRDIAGQMATNDLVGLSRENGWAKFLKGNGSSDVKEIGGNTILNYVKSTLLPGDDIILGRMTNYTGRMLDGDLKRDIKRVTEACKNEQYGGSYDALQTVRCLEDGYMSIPRIDAILNGGQ